MLETSSNYDFEYLYVENISCFFGIIEFKIYEYIIKSLNEYEIDNSSNGSFVILLKNNRKS